MYKFDCFTCCVEESHAESVKTKVEANLVIFEFIFLVLYSKIAMETGKELNYLLILYMPSLLFSYSDA